MSVERAIGNRLLRFEPGQLLVELTRHGDDHVGAGHARRLGRFVGEHREDHRDPGAGVVPGVGDLTGLEQRIHRHHDRAEPQDRVVDDREVGDVRHQHRHPVTGGDAVAGEQGRQSGGRAVERAVAEDRLALLDRRQARVARGPFGYPGRDVRLAAYGLARSG